jgi:hypothetical protein
MDKHASPRKTMPCVHSKIIVILRQRPPLRQTASVEALSPVHRLPWRQLGCSVPAMAVDAILLPIGRSLHEPCQFTSKWMVCTDQCASSFFAPLQRGSQNSAR